MQNILIIVFTAGYLAIAFEHLIRVNKAASALLTAVICWILLISGVTDRDQVVHELMEHLSEIAGILFFLLGAMTIVELIDAHDGFEVILSRIGTGSNRKLLLTVSLFTFFLSAMLDNLTTAIVMVSLVRKLVASRDDRLIFAGMVVIAANAGGAWSPIGDVTTTMLWIGGQISPAGIIRNTFIPSALCLLPPLFGLGAGLKGNSFRPARKSEEVESRSTHFERTAVFFIGLSCLLIVPVFKAITHLPPFMGMLFGLSVMWILTEFIHYRKDEIDKDRYSVNYALRKIDTPSILFFLGILLAVAALGSSGVLLSLAHILTEYLKNDSLIVISMGLLSSIVDNVPLVAAAQGMYPLGQYQTDHYFWLFLAYATGTGGSILVIGSAAGVAIMGMMKIDFFSYLRKISFWAFLGYMAGALCFILLHNFAR
jgi:Na+/H+ antiporter NhaD/arsenite permease-like protein